MRRLAFALSLFTIFSFAVSNAAAQNSANTSVPSLINYSGTVRDVSGNALNSPRTLGVTFAIYSQAEGGVPLWSEVQNVAVTASGRYAVLLGSTSSAGLPTDLFSPAEQRWLGVRVEGQPEQPRVLLVSVPYAMKAAEAETLAGHSVSEFVTADTLQSAVKQQVQQIQQPSPSHTTTLGVSPNLSSDLYVNNGTVLQTGTNFNIDGTGTAATLNAVSQYQLNGVPVIGVSGYLSQSLGYQAGFSNTGNLNTFAGFLAGSGNTSGAFNTVLGAQANAANTTGSYNTIVGAWAGLSNTGTNNAFYGAYAGYSNTSGVNNMFFGTNAGNKNTTGNGNFFLGAGSGYNNTTGNDNTFLGYLSGQNADAMASNNLYVGSLGAAAESGTIRVGDPASQTAAYMAGISGASTKAGVPVFIDTNGKLGTTGNAAGLVNSVFGRSGNVTSQLGDYNFGQISGMVLSAQLGGSYSQAVTFNNANNSFQGNFTGNGSGLNGVLPAPGSPNYIQNSGLQQDASFNITGPATVWNGFTVQSGMQALNTLPNNVAIVAQDNNTSQNSAGILGLTQNPAGTGINGKAQATTGIGTGVLGESKSPTGAGTIGVDNNTSGRSFGVVGYSASTGGFGAVGASPGVATAGYTQTCTALDTCTLTTGTAGQFVTKTGGTLLQGLSGGDLNSLAQVFAVDDLGNVSSSGNLTAAGVYSTKVTGGVQLYVDSTGHIGISASSGRFKEQVRNMGDSSSALMKLRPVTYFYKPQYDDGARTLQYGLIAEEVAEVYPELVAYDADAKPYTVKYQYLATMLLNELQKEHRKVEELQSQLQVENAKLKTQNEQLEQRLKRVEALLLSRTNSVVAQTVQEVSAQPEGNQK